MTTPTYAAATYAKLIVWTNSPTTVEDLKRILAEVSTEDLFAVVKYSTLPTAAVRIAWAEVARRRGLFDFDIRATELGSELRLDLVAEARGITETIGLKE